MLTTSNEQRDLLAKLSAVSEQVEGYRATLHMLERERLQLQTRLRLTGWRPPTPRGGSE